MIRTIVALLVAAGLACAAAPAAQRARAIAPGVHVGAVGVGGMLPVPARAELEARLAAPIAVGNEQVAPADLGARIDVTGAVSAALAATPGSRIDLPVTTRADRVDAVVAKLAKQYARAPVPERVIGAKNDRPVFAPAKAGRAVDTKALRAALVNALATGAPVKPVIRATYATKPIGAVIVVDRA
jgi:hypothetical protein